jgi:hypothetical protein
MAGDYCEFTRVVRYLPYHPDAPVRVYERDCMFPWLVAGRDHKVSADGGGSLEEGVGVGWVGGAESKEAFVVAGEGALPTVNGCWRRKLNPADSQLGRPHVASAFAVTGREAPARKYLDWHWQKTFIA